MYIAHWGIDEIPQRGQVDDDDYVKCMHRLSLAYDRMNERKVLIFMYVVDHVWD